VAQALNRAVIVNANKSFFISYSSHNLLLYPASVPLGCEKEIGFRGMDNSHDGHDGLGVRRYRRVSGRKRRNGAYMGLDFLVRFSSARSIS